MSHPRILLQLDSDRQPSVFDAVVAIDAGVEHLLQYGGVDKAGVRSLVHGAIFTRGPADLRNTAVFVGGSNVALGEALLEEVKGSFFGPMRVSVLMDASGANTTAAAAVLAAARHVDLSESSAVVLAATGPVGQRVVRLLAQAGASVRVVSREQSRAEEVCQRIGSVVSNARVEAFSAQQLAQSLDKAQIVVAAGAAGVVLLPSDVFQQSRDLKVAIDLNAVPPLGIEGIEVTDKAKVKQGVTCYGAIGVGGTKMKIHKAAIQRLFQSNDQILDAEQIYALGLELEKA
jgi:hypothetical protein